MVCYLLLKGGRSYPSIILPWVPGGKGGVSVYQSAIVLMEVPYKFSWSSKQQNRQYVLRTLEATLPFYRKSWHDTLAYTDWGQKLASVHMYKTRSENLPNHTKDRQKFVHQRQFWTSTSGPSWQHQCREDLGAENCGGFSHHSDSSSRTAESVQKKNWHFVEPLAFVKTIFWPLTVSHNSCSPITMFLIF